MVKIVSMFAPERSWRRTCFPLQSASQAVVSYGCTITRFPPGTSRMLAFLPILLMTAQAAAPPANAAPQGRPQVFIAPSGEPFRVYGDVPYPIADWFSGADTNGDGKLDSGEFSAD